MVPADLRTRPESVDDLTPDPTGVPDNAMSIGITRSTSATVGGHHVVARRAEMQLRDPTDRSAGAGTATNAIPAHH